MPEDGSFGEPRGEPSELSGWIQCNRKVPQMGTKEAEKSGPERWQCMKDLTSLDLLALKMEDGAASPGMQVASKSWKGPGSRFSTRAPERNAALLTP